MRSFFISFRLSRSELRAQSEIDFYRHTSLLAPLPLEALVEPLDSISVDYYWIEL